MKKLALAGILMLGIAQGAHAVDYVQKRRAWATNEVEAVKAITNAVNVLEQTNAERLSLGGANDFKDSDFTTATTPNGNYLVHVDSYTAKAVLDTVLPALRAVVKTDNTNRDLLNKMIP